MSVENHHCTFTPECPYSLCYTHLRRDTHQKTNVIGTCLSLDDLYFHLLAQFFDDFDDVPVQRLVNYFSPVLRANTRLYSHR